MIICYTHRPMPNLIVLREASCSSWWEQNMGEEKAQIRDPHGAQGNTEEEGEGTGRNGGSRNWSGCNVIMRLEYMQKK